MCPNFYPMDGYFNASFGGQGFDDREGGYYPGGGGGYNPGDFTGGGGYNPGGATGGGGFNPGIDMDGGRYNPDNLDSVSSGV